MSRTLLVAAITRTSQMHPDDIDAKGVYLVEGIDASLSDGDAADTALASFHAHQGIKVLDDFEFIVLDPSLRVALEADHGDDRDELDCVKIQSHFDSWMEEASRAILMT